MPQQEISAMDRNALEFFCVSLYTEFLSDLHKNFHVVSTDHKNVKCQISNFYYTHVLCK